MDSTRLELQAGGTAEPEQSPRRPGLRVIPSYRKGRDEAEKAETRKLGSGHRLPRRV